MTLFDESVRRHLVQAAAALYDRGLTPGRTGNVSVRSDDAILITPTGACLGRLDPDRLAVTTIDGVPVSGDLPSKELSLHRALYDRQPGSRAIAHLHSTSAVAVSCLPEVVARGGLRPLTPYVVMKADGLRLVDYAAPGSVELVDKVATAAAGSRSLLLRNHGSLAAASTLEDALDAVEEIEEAARLHLLLRDLSPVHLTDAQVAELRSRFSG